MLKICSIETKIDGSELFNFQRKLGDIGPALYLIAANKNAANHSVPLSEHNELMNFKNKKVQPINSFYLFHICFPPLLDFSGKMYSENPYQAFVPN